MERNFYDKNGKFTNNLEELGIKFQAIPGFKMPPVIEYTSDMFEASLQFEDGPEKINIRNDGLTWTSQDKK
jgi:hypothetical protein